MASTRKIQTSWCFVSSKTNYQSYALDWIIINNHSKHSTKRSNTIWISWLRTVEWFGVAVGLSKLHRQEKCRHLGVLSKTNHRSHSLDWIILNYHSKHSTKRSSTIQIHRSREWKGSAMVLDCQNGIDKKNSDLWVFWAKPFTDPMQWIATNKIPNF